MKLNILILLSLISIKLFAGNSLNRLPSTEGDPDSFIADSINVINGDYCEVVRDLSIIGPDLLVLDRYFNSKDYVTGKEAGGWRILPQRFLVIGQDPGGKSCKVGKDEFKWSLAFTGERSGGILTYKGWVKTDGTTKDPLKIDLVQDAIGAVNTFTQEMSGKTCLLSRSLVSQGQTCEVRLGDGTRRIYQKVESLPSTILGEELNPLLAAKVYRPQYFLLTQEILPSGNRLNFSYDSQGHLTRLEMKNASEKKLLSWITFSYHLGKESSYIKMATSDERELIYHFSLSDDHYLLTSVESSNALPCSYEYNNNLLVKKTLPEGQEINLTYHQNGKVQSIKSLRSDHFFQYQDNYTDVFDRGGLKTRYHFDLRNQLTAIERYDSQENLYRKERKFWGKSKLNAGLLLAKTVEDGTNSIYSYRSFEYDAQGNVIEEKLYGNLTGNKDIILSVSDQGVLLEETEHFVKTYTYSTDGFNLLIKKGDCKGNQVTYDYKNGTNLLIQQFTYERTSIKKRLFKAYNKDGICVRELEDDSPYEKESQIYWGGYSTNTEQHLKVIKPKENLPGVGLPEVIEEKHLADQKNDKKLLIKKLVNTFDAQGHLLSCDTYDSTGTYAYTEKRTYHPVGMILSETDCAGREMHYTYDNACRKTSASFQGKITLYRYDQRGYLIEEKEFSEGLEHITSFVYDDLGRKLASTNFLGGTTSFDYDEFGRLIKVNHPEVLNEHGELIRPTFVYTYDLFGNVTSTQDPLGFVTYKTYNVYGKPTKISYPDGTSELFKYDPEGSLHRSLTRDQILTVSEYDYLGRVIHAEISQLNESGSVWYLWTENYWYNGFRCIEEKKDRLVIKYICDSAGRLTAVAKHEVNSETEAKKQLTEIEYDSLGRVSKKKIWFDIGKEDFSVECYERDSLGNITEKRIEDAKGQVFLKKSFVFDLFGRCTEEISYNSSGSTASLKTRYDAWGEPILIEDALGNETTIVAKESCISTLGQKIVKKTIVNPLGVQTQIQLDLLGRVVSIVKKDPMNVLLSQQETRYDALGNKVSEKYFQVVGGDIVGVQENRLIFGPMGRVEEEVGKASYSYNTLGQLISQKNPGGSHIDYTYNEAGEISKIESIGAKGREVYYGYSYDKQGNVTSTNVKNQLIEQTMSRTYNAFGQVTEEYISSNKPIQFTYDRKGRLTSITLPDKSKIEYVYDALFGREVRRLSADGKVLYSHTYDSYDLQGRLLEETLIGYGGQRIHTHDVTGKKLSIKSELMQEDIVRDTIGRILKIQREGSSGSFEQEFRYNDLSQMVFEKGESSTTYTCDSLDNRLKENTEALIYQGFNQLVSSSEGNQSYDIQGTMNQKNFNGKKITCEGNALGQITFIAGDTFGYNAFNRLTAQKTSDNEKKTFFYVGDHEIGSLDAKGEIVELRVPGLVGDEISLKSVAIEIKGDVFLPLHDFAGNTTALVDPYNGQVIESYAYTAFGEETIYDENGDQIQDAINPWRFAEKRKIGDFIFFGKRFYDPATGRFISPDPLGLQDGPNLYAYLHHNPLNYQDRFGFASENPSENKFEGYFYGEVEPHCYCERHRTCKRGGSLSSLPCVSYCDSFEDFYAVPRAGEDFWASNDFQPFFEKSKVYDLKLPELANKGIGFINGINNSFKQAEESARYISKLAGDCNIHAVYNATHGIDADLIESKMGLHFIATEPVRQLHKMWNSFFDQASGDAKFLMICHSQGAIHVRNALLDYPPELRDRILVIAIAPAGYIYQESCAQVIHYRVNGMQDIVPLLDRKGANRSKDTTVILESHPDASYLDHSILSPTYAEKLSDDIILYITGQGRLL